MGLLKNYREIILPVSKAKITVRDLKPYDYVFIGSVPDTFAEWQEKAKQKETLEKATLSDFKPQEIEYIAACCARSVVKIHPARPTDPDMKFVSKQPSDCLKNEFSFFDLGAGDVDVLITEVFKDRGDGGLVPSTFPKK